jgi:asparagine synthase (glutamine-hydrolysing)
MCGIAGIYARRGEATQRRETLENMVAMLQSRGPDGEGFHLDGPIALGHARLSIIDLETGDQPIHNTDRTVWVVFNGEIFNYLELRSMLQGRGYRFYTRSDTEVIVHLYDEFGDDFVDHLNGQFAIALWDHRRERLVLTRDRAGILPLFYSQRENGFVFASEVKALLAAFDQAPEPDLTALDALMTLWAPVSPETVFSGVYEVSPGEQLVVDANGLRRRRYWDWSFPESPGDYIGGTDEELATELHDLLVDATRLRLRADVPVGAYLSGGLDSSVLVSLIHHHGGVPLRTFSIGFDDAGLDESGFQQRMIDHLGADHSRVQCTNADVAARFPETIWRTEQPVLRTAPVPMGILSGLVREQGYKVVLTGEGADEVLGGYDLFKEAKIRQFWAKDPASSMRPLLLQRLYPYLNLTQNQGQAYLRNFFGVGLDNPQQPGFSHLPRWDTTARTKAFLSPEARDAVAGDAAERMIASLPAGLSRWHPFNRAQYLEAKSLMAGYLLSSQGDRMLMANSVEGRFPFLDHRVIEFANRLHPKQKMRVLNEKYLLKAAMRQYLPGDIVKRHKQPYRAPDIPAFFSGTRPEYVNDMLSGETLRRFGYFDPDKVSRLLRKIDRGMAIGYKDNMALVGILSTQLWHHHFIDGFAHNFRRNPVDGRAGKAHGG